MIAVKSLGRVWYQQCSSEISIKCLGTSRIAVKSSKSLGTSRIAEEFPGRVWAPA